MDLQMVCSDDGDGDCCRTHGLSPIPHSGPPLSVNCLLHAQRGYIFTGYDDLDPAVCLVP